MILYPRAFDRFLIMPKGELEYSFKTIGHRRPVLWESEISG